MCIDMRCDVRTYICLVVFLHMCVVLCCSLEGMVEGLKTSLQQSKDQLQEKEVAYSILQEQGSQVRK